MRDIRWASLAVLAALILPATSSAAQSCKTVTAKIQMRHWVRRHGHWKHVAYLKTEHKQVCEGPEVGRFESVLTVHDAAGNDLQVFAGVIDPGTPANEFSAPKAGRRLLAVFVALTNSSESTISSDANSDTTVIGTDGQSYTPSYNELAACKNFSYGMFSLLPGEAENGCVVYELPAGVNVQAVQFALAGLSVEAQWNA